MFPCRPSIHHGLKPPPLNLSLIVNVHFVGIAIITRAIMTSIQNKVLFTALPLLWVSGLE